MKHNQSIQGLMQLLSAQVQGWHGSLSSQQITLLQEYATLLTTYSEANVIGARDIRSIILDHVLDSLSCVSLQDIELVGKLVDVGAGGGLPGIPLAIASPALEVTLLEATEKKIKFLRYVQKQLGLANTNVLNERAEEAAKRAGLRDNHDIATSRALASLPVVIEYCAPFVREGGVILAMKGKVEEVELSSGKLAAAKLGAELLDVVQVALRPELEQKQRHIVVFRKIGSTPTGYPRRVGLAKKRPLGV